MNFEGYTIVFQFITLQTPSSSDKTLGQLILLTLLLIVIQGLNTLKNLILQPIFWCLKLVTGQERQVRKIRFALPSESGSFIRRKPDLVFLHLDSFVWKFDIEIEHHVRLENQDRDRDLLITLRSVELHHGYDTIQGLPTIAYHVIEFLHIRLESVYHRQYPIAEN